MKEKLELKQILPYAAYGLYGVVEDFEENTIYVNVKLQSIGIFDECLSFDECIDVYLDEPKDAIFKPILRPLSDLYEKVDYFENTYPSFDITQIDSLINDPIWLNHCEYLLVQYLFQWHFDVFGLIDKGLAIDLNTLP